MRADVARDFTYEFLPPTHGVNCPTPYATLRDAIGDLPLWPTGEYHEQTFHGHYLTRNRKRRWDEQSFTIVANAAHVPLHPLGSPMTFVGKDKWQLNGEENRRLSWRECARLQCLPDGISPGGTLLDRYRVIGNAVPPVFGRALLAPVMRHECR